MHGELPKNLKLSGKNRTRRIIASGLVVLAIGGALYYAYSGGTGTTQRRPGRFGGGDGPTPVLAASAVSADVPVYINAVGTTRALNTVTVRVQVDGRLLQVNFKEGQEVKKGDVLARIDPTTYQAALDQALAKKAQDEALLDNAKNDLDRYEKLAATNAINKQQADTQRALVAQYTAQVQADTAAVDSARATLGYTNVTAPIDGRTGLRLVDEGNIIRASDANGLVVLTQIKPIAVLFSLPQQDLPRVNAAFAKGPLAADAIRSDSGEIVDRGSMTVVDNQVDSTTGTVKLKAEFPNANLQLWPGQFINVRLLVDTLRQVTVVPTSALQRGPNGTFIYVIKDDNTAQMRPVQVQKQDENQTVIQSGLAPGERVITTGFSRLTDGTRVGVTAGTGTPAPPAANPAPRAGQRQPGAANGERRQRGGANSTANPPQ